MKKIGALRVQLRQSGWTCRQGRGSHEIWQDPDDRRRRVVLSGRNSKDALHYQEARVRKFHRGLMVYTTSPVE